MANNNMDFTFKPLISPVALAQLEQQRQQQEIENKRQANNDAFTRIEQVTNLASSLAQNMVAASAKRQLNQSIETLSKASPALDPKMSSALTIPESPVGSPIEDAEGNMTAKPAYSNEAAVMADRQAKKQAALKAMQLADPKTLAQTLAKQQLPSMSPMKASQFQFEDKIDPQTHQVYSVLIDKFNPGRVLTLDGQELPNDVSGRLIKYFAPAIGTSPTTGLTTVTQRTPSPSQNPVPDNTLPPKGTPNDGAESGIAPPTHALPYAKRALKEKQEISDQVKTLRADPLFESSEIVLNTVGNFKSVLNQDLAVSQGAIKGLAARVLAGEKGVMTDRDVDRQLGQDYANRFNRLVRGAMDGRLSDKDYRELQSIIQMTADRAAEQYNTVQSQNLDSLQTQFGLPDKDAKTLLKFRDPSAVLAVQGQGSVKPTDRAVGTRITSDQEQKKADLRKKLGL